MFLPSAFGRLASEGGSFPIVHDPKKPSRVRRADDVALSPGTRLDDDPRGGSRGEREVGASPLIEAMALDLSPTIPPRGSRPSRASRRSAFDRAKSIRQIPHLESKGKGRGEKRKRGE